MSNSKNNKNNRGQPVDFMTLKREYIVAERKGHNPDPTTLITSGGERYAKPNSTYVHRTKHQKRRARRIKRAQITHNKTLALQERDDYLTRNLTDKQRSEYNKIIGIDEEFREYIDYRYVTG